MAGTCNRWRGLSKGKARAPMAMTLAAMVGVVPMVVYALILHWFDR